jgi:conjugative transfer signal peptidase TraF
MRDTTLPGLRIGATARRRGGRRRRPHQTLVLAGLGLGLIGCAWLADSAPRLVWNASASAPLGLYRVEVGARIARGDAVLAVLPDAPRRLAAERLYLPADVPLIKHVAAMAGDRICGEGDGVSINGRVVAHRLAHDSKGRPLPRWTGCRVLADSEVLLLMAGVPGSFDGRYFGPVDAAQIVGKLLPLWTE